MWGRTQAGRRPTGLGAGESRLTDSTTLPTRPGLLDLTPATDGGLGGAKDPEDRRRGATREWVSELVNSYGRIRFLN